MKRFSILLAAAALFAAVAGCQKEPAGNADGQESDVYVEFTINFEDGMTKADDDHNSSNVAVGTDEEHAVKYAYLYFFDASNKYAQTVKIAAGDITSSKEMEGSIVKKTTVPTQLTPGKYNVYATLNYEVSDLTTTTTETDFKEMTYAHDYASYDMDTDGIPMSSRSSDGVMCQNVTVSADNTQDSPVQIQLFVERMLAKLTVKNKYSSYTIPGASVSLTHYKPVNLAKNAYVYRHVGADASSTSFGVITDDNYVIDPETSIKTTGDLAGVNLYNGVKSITHDIAIPADGATSPPMYCAENTMLVNSQYKTYGTAFAFAAKVKPADDTYFANNGASVVATTYSTGDLWYFDGAFYDSLESLNSHKGLSLGVTPSKNNYYKKFGVKYFVGGICYYNYYIRHFDNGNDHSMGKMEFAIVRNNDYQVTVTGINALGEDTPGAAAEVIESGKSYFQATLLVRPWVVRAQNAVLG